MDGEGGSERVIVLWFPGAASRPWLLAALRSGQREPGLGQGVPPSLWPSGSLLSSSLQALIPTGLQLPQGIAAAPGHRHLWGPGDSWCGGVRV